MNVEKLCLILAGAALVAAVVGHNNPEATGLGKALMSVFIIGYFITHFVKAQSRP
jgi:hypothetical protein